MYVALARFMLVPGDTETVMPCAPNVSAKSVNSAV